MKRAQYSATIFDFLNSPDALILGELAGNSGFAVGLEQMESWKEEIFILQSVLRTYQSEGSIFLEYTIPRMGRRIDAVLILGSIIFVLEFKINGKDFDKYAIDQVVDYALDLKNFHESSHDKHIVPILVATEAKPDKHSIVISPTPHDDRLYSPLCTNADELGAVIGRTLGVIAGQPINVEEWEAGRYCPTPTIIEAAMALYGGHAVEEISRHGAGEINLSGTSEEVSEIIERSMRNSSKAICFVTGVPGAGKTLVGLDIATKYQDKDSKLHSVYLSGNGPLVQILQEALARDQVRRKKERGKKVSKREAHSEVKAFVQNVHHFRDECLKDETRAPIEHVALFDEAQRAWDLAQTSSFMRRKKNRPGFDTSEPDYLISCLNRHPDWAVVVCLVGGGQEINTGEAGIGEWIESWSRSYPDWQLYISPQLTDSEYGAGLALNALEGKSNVIFREKLHLAVSMRSFRAGHVSLLVKNLLDLKLSEARETWSLVKDKYPIVISRDVALAKRWLRDKARGNERYGIVVSSQAERLKPHAINVRSPMNPIHWFLDGKDDVRSSFFLEDVATEFHVQGLELDWACVAWDGDFRYDPQRHGWQHFSFRGSKWMKIRKTEAMAFQINAYRVLLTRARQGMVILVPEGDISDLTRQPGYYDETFQMLKSIGFPELT